MGVPKPPTVPAYYIQCVWRCYIVATADPRLFTKSLPRAFVSSSRRFFFLSVRMTIYGSVLSHLCFGPSSCSVFLEVSIAWADGPSLCHVPIFGPTKDSVLQLRCEFEMCGSGVMEVRSCVPVEVVMSFRGVVDFEGSYMEVFSCARGWDSTSCMEFVFGG